MMSSYILTNFENILVSENQIKFSFFDFLSFIITHLNNSTERLFRYEMPSTKIDKELINVLVYKSISESSRYVIKYSHELRPQRNKVMENNSGKSTKCCLPAFSTFSRMFFHCFVDRFYHLISIFYINYLQQQDEQKHGKIKNLVLW